MLGNDYMKVLTCGYVKLVSLMIIKCVNRRTLYKFANWETVSGASRRGAKPSSFPAPQRHSATCLAVAPRRRSASLKYKAGAAAPAS